MRKVFPVLVLTLAAVAGTSGVAAQPDHSGYYTNLRYIPGADDYVGIRLDVRQGASSTVEFEVCEGWCNGAETYPANIAGDRIAFTYRQRLNDGFGHETVVQVPVTGRFERRGVVVKVGDQPPERLKWERRKP